MQSNSFNLHLVFEIPNTQLFDIKKNQMTIIKEGALGIYELKEYNLMVLRLDDWQYSLNKQIPVMTQ